MKRYILLAILSVGVLSGCGKDFLTKAPVLSQSNVLTESNFEGLDKIAGGAYGPLAGLGWYGADFILANEMKTSNGKRWVNSKYDSGRYAIEYNVSISPTSTSPIWGSAYAVIHATNTVIHKLPGVEGDEAAKNNILAEMYFLRAFAHFDLVRTYSRPFKAEDDPLGVPVDTVGFKETDFPARSSVHQVYDAIVKDLLKAESLMSPDYVREGFKDGKASVSLYAIQALLSRVYLYSQQWQAAADYATKVIDSKKFKLWTADEVKANPYTADVTKAGEGEVIFEVYEDITQDYGGGNENVWGLTYFKGYGDCGASNDLKNLYAEGDARLSLISPDDDGFGLFTLKYAGKKLGAIDANNVIILRLSEMYLNRAEALAHGATVSGVTVTSDLAKIAQNRGASSEPSTVAGVLREREKELAWEGHLWFDLGRNGLPMKRTDVSGSQTPKEILPEDRRWAMPIPESEMSVNKNLVQTKGYNE